LKLLSDHPAPPAALLMEEELSVANVPGDPLVIWPKSRISSQLGPVAPGTGLSTTGEKAKKAFYFAARRS